LKIALSQSGKVTIPGKLSDDIPIGTYKSILKQAVANYPCEQVAIIDWEVSG
jgi:hypothetical protein